MRLVKEEKILKNIETLRKEMYKLHDEGTDLFDDKAVRKSQELDEIINTYISLYSSR